MLVALMLSFLLSTNSPKPPQNCVSTVFYAAHKMAVMAGCLSKIKKILTKQGYVERCMWFGRNLYFVMQDPTDEKRGWVPFTLRNGEREPLTCM